MSDHFSDFQKFFFSIDQGLQTQEAVLKTSNRHRSLAIGIPAEVDTQENRVSLRPAAVKLLVNNGHSVMIETKAGNAAKHPDQDYSEVGGQISYDKKDLFEQSDIILKIAPPTLEEISFLKPRKTIISALQLANVDVEYLYAINQKRITAIAFELLQDKGGTLPIVRAMSEIAGYTSMTIAAEYLNTYNGRGIILGGITGVPSTNVVILGAGTVAEYAARVAIGLGANVKIFDDNHYKLRRLKYDLGHTNIYTSTIDTDLLREALLMADVAIGAMRPVNGRTPTIVPEDMVAEMKPNSVIIDVSIDNGGCFETSVSTTHEKPTFRKYGVIHYCVPNMPSRVARTATHAISNILSPILLKIGNFGGIEEMIAHDANFSKGIYSFMGMLTNKSLAAKYNMRHHDINQLLAGIKRSSN